MDRYPLISYNGRILSYADGKLTVDGVVLEYLPADLFDVLSRKSEELTGELIEWYEGHEEVGEVIPSIFEVGPFSFWHDEGGLWLSSPSTHSLFVGRAHLIFDRHRHLIYRSTPQISSVVVGSEIMLIDVENNGTHMFDISKFKEWLDA
jgi:hypothetical protein